MNTQARQWFLCCQLGHGHRIRHIARLVIALFGWLVYELWFNQTSSSNYALTRFVSVELADTATIQNFIYEAHTTQKERNLGNVERKAYRAHTFVIVGYWSVKSSRERRWVRRKTSFYRRVTRLCHWQLIDAPDMLCLYTVERKKKVLPFLKHVICW